MYVTGFILSWGAVLSTTPEPRKFSKGLIFVKETDVLLSGDKWTIAVNIALDDHEDLVVVMRLMLQQIRQNIQVHRNSQNYSFDIQWEEVSRLGTMNKQLEDDLEGFRLLLFKEMPRCNLMGQGVPTRAQRGLANVLGYGLKYLFGGSRRQRR